MMGLILAELRQELVKVNRKIFDRNLSSATSGNTSVRVPRQKGLFLIKRTGVSFGDVQPEDFLLVDGQGKVLEGEGQPSKEYKFHLGIYQLRPEVGAVVHGHSPYATSYVSVKGQLPVVTAAAEAGLYKIPTVGYARPGSEELAQMVCDAFKNPETRAVVMLNHGFVTAGADIYQAFYVADVLEDNAKCAYLMEQLKGNK